jgi:isopenicillin-N epimerase
LRNAAVFPLLGLATRRLPNLVEGTAPLADPENLDALRRAFSGAEQLSNEGAAKDESLWVEVVKALPKDSESINLWSIARGVSARVVTDSLAGTYRQFEDHFPGSSYVKNQKEAIRNRLAKYVGCAPDEIALMRNTTDGVATVLFGFGLREGDEILTTSQEHEGFYAALDLRAKRDGVVVRRVRLPSPAQSPDELAEAVERAVSPRTRLIMICHLYLTGQIFPVRRVCDFAHAHGVRVLVDGALSFGQIKIDIQQLECDFYASSLHKCGCGPKGTGFLFVKPDLVTSLPPLYGYFENDTLLPMNDGRQMQKYERTGTQAEAIVLSIAAMLDLLETIGSERIQARLHYLKQYWAKQMEQEKGIRFMSSLDPNLSCALLAFEVVGKKWEEVSDSLRK